MSKVLQLQLFIVILALALRCSPAAGDEQPTSVVAWDAEADPPNATWELPKDRVPQIALRDHPVLNPSMFGANSSPYFSVFGEFLGEQVLRVYDLRNDDLIFEAKTKGLLPPTVLPSPDAKHVVAVRRDPHEAVVFAVADGREVATIPFSPTLARLAFIAPNELLVLQARETEVQIVEATTGKELRRFDVGHAIPERNPFAITPGGRYLVMAHRGRDRREPWKLSLFELSTGKRVGSVNLPERFDPLGDHEVALDISADGREVAVLNLRRPVLISFDLSNGDALAELELPAFGDRKENALYDRAKWGYGGKPLVFVPDRSGWLVYGHLLLDRKSGEVSWKVPYAEFGERTGPYRFVGDDRLLLVLPDRNSVKTGDGTSMAVLPWESG